MAATVQQRLAVISEPNRFRIVELLKDGPQPVGGIVDALGLGQPQVSRHLRLLAEALVRGMTAPMAVIKQWPWKATYPDRVTTVVRENRQHRLDPSFIFVWCSRCATHRGPPATMEGR